MRAYRWLIGLFSYADEEDEAKYFGFAHVIALLSLAPFILSFQLFRIIEPKESAASYTTNIERFLGKELEVRPRAPTHSNPDIIYEYVCSVEQLCGAPYVQFLEDYKKSETSGPMSAQFDELLDYAKWKVKDETFATITPPAVTQAGSKINTLAGVFTDKISRNATGDQGLPLLISLLLTPLFLIECLRRREFLAFLAASALPVGFVLSIVLIVGGWIDGANPAIRPVIADVLPKVTLGWLAWRGGLLSRPVVLTIVALAAISVSEALPADRRGYVMHLLEIVVALFALAIAASRRLGRSSLEGRMRMAASAGVKLLGFLAVAFTIAAILEIWEINRLLPFSKGLLPVILFILLLSALRLVVLAIETNAYFLRELGVLRVIVLLAMSLALWTPMLFLAAPYFHLVDHVLPERATNELHAHELLPKPYPHEFRDNALMGAAIQMDKAIFTFHVGVERLKAGVKYQANELLANGLAARTLAEFDKVMPTELAMAPVTTDAFLGGVKKAGEIIEENVQDAYKDLRVKMREGLAEAIKGYDIQFRDNVAGARDQIIKKINEKKAEVVQQGVARNTDIANAIWSIMMYVYAAHAFGILLFVLICIKSFMYVFARVAFHRSHGTVLSLAEADAGATSPVASAIRHFGGQYVIRADRPVTYFVSRRFQCRGKAPRFAIPQPFHAPIARLLHKATTMNRVALAPGDGTVSCTATQGAQFVEWDLFPGETVVFDFRNFVAMTEDVTVSTLISLRLSTLLLGRFIFSTATGPGKLVLMTDGRAEITGDDDIAESLPPQRLVAMHRDTRLHVESELNIVDVYLSDAYVRPAAGARVIVDVDSQRGGSAGLGRFILHFLWPG